MLMCDIPLLSEGFGLVTPFQGTFYQKLLSGAICLARAHVESPV